MSQADLPVLDPEEEDGVELATHLNDWRDAISTSHSGTSRPSYAEEAMVWVDKSGSPTWIIKMFNGMVAPDDDDIVLMTVNKTTGAVSVNFSSIDGSTTGDDTLLDMERNYSSAATQNLAVLSDIGTANNFSHLLIEALRPALVLSDLTSSSYDFRLGIDSNTIKLTIDTDGDNGRDASGHFDDITAFSVDGTDFLIPLIFKLGSGPTTISTAAGKLLPAAIDFTGASSGQVVYYNGSTVLFGSVGSFYTVDLTSGVTGVLPDANVANNLTITGGTITNSPISGSTGSFTTLGASSTSTLAAVSATDVTITGVVNATSDLQFFRSSGGTDNANIVFDYADDLAQIIFRRGSTALFSFFAQADSGATTHGFAIERDGDAVYFGIGLANFFRVQRDSSSSGTVGVYAASFEAIPVNHNVILSPTGSGVVTINPSTLGTMDNMTVGGTTRAAGSFTTLTLTTPLSVANGGTGIASGTSGGIPYFSGSGTIASSAALGSTHVVLGGGAGSPPTASSALLFVAGTSLQIVSNLPSFVLNHTGGASNTKAWAFSLDATRIHLSTYSDAGALGTSALIVTRSGTTVTAVDITATTTTINGPLVTTGTLTVASDTDVTVTLGRLKIGYTSVADRVYMAHIDNFDNTNFAIAFLQSGQININSKSGTSIAFTNAGTTVATISSTTLAVTGNITATTTIAATTALSSGTTLTVGTGFITTDFTSANQRLVSIASGTLAVTSADYCIRVDPEGAGTTDVLDTITGGTAGQHLILCCSTLTDVITITNGFSSYTTGAFITGTNADLTQNWYNFYHFIYNGTNWVRIN